MITNDNILTLSEVAELLKISKPTIYRKIKSGEIKARKVGKSWRFLESDLVALVKNEPKDVEEIDPSLPVDNKAVSPICKKYYIGLLYIFGSFSEGTSDNISDIDIGVVFLPNIDTNKAHRLFAEIKDSFAQLIPDTEIDLIFLQNVGPLVQEQAVLGKCIYSISDFFMTRYEDNVTREAMDMRFFQKRFNHDMIEDIREGDFFAA